MTRRRRRKTNGMSYTVRDGLLQVTAGLLTDRHLDDQCAWCQLYKRGKAQQPCPENPQMELFG